MESIVEEYLLPEKVTVGEYIGQRLRQLGVTHIFTVPGDFLLNLLDELNKDPSLTMVGCCNEMVAGYAADGYCRASCGLGVVCGKKDCCVCFPNTFHSSSYHLPLQSHIWLEDSQS